MKSVLSKKFSWYDIIVYTVPSILMLATISIYLIADGFFVAYFIGTTALAAVNIVYPLSGAFLAVSIMITMGSSAIVSKRLGEGKAQSANEGFSFIVYCGIIFSVIVTIFTQLYLDEVIDFLGARPEHHLLCISYARMLFWFSPMFMLQILFQTYFGVAGKPKFGLFLTIISGVTNLILDYVFIGIFGLGMFGAGLATGIGYSIGGLYGLFYFTFMKQGLHLVSLKNDYPLLLNSCLNGASEMIGNLSNSITTFLFNIAFAKYYGSNGVAAIAIVLYLQFIFSSVYMGYSVGVSPIIGFKYGEGNNKQLSILLKTSIAFIGVMSVIVFFVSRQYIELIAQVFVPTNTEVFRLAVDGFMFFSVSFLFCGVNIFASAWFTALSNGGVSAIIAILRTLVFILISIKILPLLIGANGLWFAMPVAECLGLVVSIIYILKYRKVYGY